jgi:uncharacterized protein YkwD
MRPRDFAPVSALLLCALAAPPAFAGRFEDQLLVELNNVRAHPQAYTRELRREALVDARYGDPYSDPGAQEDPEAVEDAIDFLMRQPPLGPLRADPRLAAAARDHVERQGPSGGVGHGAPGSFAHRLQSEGLYAGLSAENISYGQNSPKDVIRQLVIDSRVPNRGHRKNIFGQGFTAAGVACGPHAEWGSMCVIDFAGAIVRR